MEEEQKHAKFSPSKLPRIIRCPGSARFEVPNHTSSTYADEGTYLHSLVEDYLNRDEYQIPKEARLHEDQSKHDDYKSAVEACLEYIFTLKASNPGYDKEYIEARVSLKNFSDHCDCAQLDDVEGTVDYILVANRELFIVDWKFGKGLLVDPDSEQLKAYAIGALKDPISAKFFDKVHCIVGQPRVGDEAFKVKTYSIDELLSWLTQELAPALRQTMSSDPIFRPSDKACRWCVRRTRCEARHSEALKVAEDVFKVHAVIATKPADEEFIQALKDLLDKAPILKGYLKDIHNFAFATIAAGKEFPGYKIVAGRSIRKWANEETAKQVLEEHGYDVSELSEVVFFSPTKVEKVLGKAKAKEDFFTTLVVKPAGAPTMTTESDSRPPLKFQTAEECFAAYVEQEE